MYFSKNLSQAFTLVFALLAFCAPAFAQKSSTTAAILGIVADSATLHPLEYAAVSVYPKDSTTPVGGMITDDKGAFTIADLKPGVYRLKVEFIGYRPKIKDNITLKAGNNDIGTVSIADKSNKMKEVTITGQKSFVENKLDKLVFNVGNDVTSSGGSATDVLKKVPQVDVDINGNVELLGNANIKVLLNGKPSAQFDNNLAEALRVIPASQIDKIEVITSPGAQYDVEGTGGIINIILKESKVKGINGTFNISAGTRVENTSLYLHAQNGPVEFNFSVSGNANLSGNVPTSSNRTADSAGIVQTRLLQSGTGSTYWYGYRSQLGMDWDITKTDHFSVNLGYFFHGNQNTGSLNQQQLAYGVNPIDALSGRNTTSGDGYGGADLTLNYKKKFKGEGHELMVFARPAAYNELETYSRKNAEQSVTVSGAGGAQHEHFFDFNYGADYSRPLGKDIVLNVGAKATVSRINVDANHTVLDMGSGNYVDDPTFLNNYANYRDVYAAYASITFPFFKNYSLKLGMRDEYTLFYKTSPTDSLIPAYNTPAPSAVISRSFGKKQSLKLAYSHRIQRPGYWDLNPYIDASDPLNISSGNPALKPEKVDNLDLTYFQSFEKGRSLMVMAYYRYSTEDQQEYIYFDSQLKVGDSVYKNVSVTTMENAGIQYVSGFNVSGTYTAFDEKMEIRGNAIVFNKYIVSSIIAGATANSLNYRLNGNVTYKFGKDWVVEGFCNYRSARTEIQGTFPGYLSYSFAFKKLFWKKNGSLAFTTTDPFNQYIDQATNVSGVGFSMYNDRKMPYRSFGLAFSYKFGKLEFFDKHDGGEHGGGEEM